MKRAVGLGLLAFLFASAVFAHPHFNKTVTVTLPQGVETYLQ